MKIVNYLLISLLVFPLVFLGVYEIVQADTTRLTPIECYVGQKLVFKGVMRGRYDRSYHNTFWKFTDHQTGKTITFGGYCRTSYHRSVPTSSIKGAVK